MIRARTVQLTVTGAIAIALLSASVAHACVFDSDCDDEQFCNGVETCNQLTTLCLPGLPPLCDDAFLCTLDTCNEATDSCDHTPLNSACDDGVFCNGEETCSSLVGCEAATPVDCNDGIDCTTDSCNETTDSCDNTPVDAVCDDGLFCNGPETCDAILDCQAGPAACPGLACDEGGDQCTGCSDDTDCDDGLWCNGAETCDGSNVCQPGAAPNCDDGVGCTIDSCNESTDSCDNSPDDGTCNDGLWCNSDETCHATLDCQAGSAPDCSDGVGCTADSCNESTDSCDNTPVDAVCDDGLFCNGPETCDAALDCQPAVGPCNDGVACTSDVCNESTDSCHHTPDDDACDDGLWCNGPETCDTVLGCEANAAPDCDDGVDCTLDDCDEDADVCTHTADDSLCNDGQFCNGEETCHPLIDCQAGTAPDCSDTVGCTADTCNEDADACENTPSNAACDDGVFCNGAETCDPTNGCQPSTPVDCNDGVGCTTDACDEDANACVNVPIDAACDDGSYCNGAETCNPTLDCVPGTLVECTPLNVQCQVQVCNETEQTCTTIASADGEPCDDGSACTVDDTCSGGECIGELLCDEPCEGCSDGVCYERCGVPLATEPGRQPKTVDALFIARAAVSLASCPLCVCDVNSSGRITASDGLATVRKAVGLNTLLVCPDHVSLVAGATSTTTSTSSTLVTDSTTTTTYY